MPRPETGGYKLAHLGPGLWLQLSDDGRTLFRLVRYRESGDAERGDGRPVIGWYWRAERLCGDMDDDHNELVERDPHGRIAAWDVDALAADSSAVPWDHWWSINLATRREAAEKARAYVEED